MLNFNINSLKLFPVNPAIAQAESAKPWILLIFFIPNFEDNNVGRVLKPPPYPALIINNKIITIIDIFNCVNNPNTVINIELIKII